MGAMLAIHTAAGAQTEPAALLLETDLSWREIVAPVEPFLRSVAIKLAAQVE